MENFRLDLFQKTEGELVRILQGESVKKKHKKHYGSKSMQWTGV